MVSACPEVMVRSEVSSEGDTAQAVDYRDVMRMDRRDFFIGRQLCPVMFIIIVARETTLGLGVPTSRTMSFQ